MATMLFFFCPRVVIRGTLLSILSLLQSFANASKAFFAPSKKRDCTSFYRMWNPVTGGIHESRDVIWLHKMYSYQKPSSLGKESTLIRFSVIDE
jgi:hypothetical protein